VIAKELRTKDDKELNVLLAEARSKLFDHKIKNGIHQLVDVSQIRKTRREIARIETILRSREIAKASQAEQE
jgi:large subunit ribosomal protein L29